MFCGKHYVFNATPANGEHLDPTAACPPLKDDPQIAALVAEKQAKDDAKIAELAAKRRQADPNSSIRTAASIPHSLIASPR